MRNMGIIDDYYYFVYYDELCPKGLLTLKTPPVILALSPVRSTQERGIKIFPLNQMLQRLPILLEQVQGSYNSESLLNEIRQVVISLHCAKQI